MSDKPEESPAGDDKNIGKAKSKIRFLDQVDKMKANGLFKSTILEDRDGSGKAYFVEFFWRKLTVAEFKDISRMKMMVGDGGVKQAVDDAVGMNEKTCELCVMAWRKIGHPDDETTEVEKLTYEARSGMPALWLMHIGDQIINASGGSAKVESKNW